MLSKCGLADTFYNILQIPLEGCVAISMSYLLGRAFSTPLGTAFWRASGTLESPVAWLTWLVLPVSWTTAIHNQSYSNQRWRQIIVSGWDAGEKKQQSWEAIWGSDIVRTHSRLGRYPQPPWEASPGPSAARRSQTGDQWHGIGGW